MALLSVSRTSAILRSSGGALATPTLAYTQRRWKSKSKRMYPLAPYLVPFYKIGETAPPDPEKPADTPEKFVKFYGVPPTADPEAGLQERKGVKEGLDMSFLNIVKGGEVPKVKDDSEYPDWLWTIHHRRDSLPSLLEQDFDELSHAQRRRLFRLETRHTMRHNNRMMKRQKFKRKRGTLPLVRPLREWVEDE